MKFQAIVTLVCLLSIQFYESKQSKEEECENEEERVENCAENFLLYRNTTLPQTIPEFNKFCSANKAQESCLSNHSIKCLSHSANQAITELIRTMAKQNRAICSNKNRQRLYIRSNQCLNKQTSAGSCYNRFVQNIHGIHQFSQEEKIPIICCNYHDFLKCIEDKTKQCNKEATNVMNRLLQNYAGETLNYVCKEYKTSTSCANKLQVSADHLSEIKEEVPKTFFSLLVKIYLS